MRNVFVYCEIEDSTVADVSLELLTKGKSLAQRLNCKLEAIAIGANLNGIENQIFKYGVDVIHLLMINDWLHIPHCLMHQLYVN
jgi:electron transfer flavoprotein alpha subunit